MIKVFGHLSPDTDATCSAILLAWHLNNHTSYKAVPFVLGEINKETKFVLERWNTPEPELLQSIEADEEVAIVDTNNPQELFPNINDAMIVQIIDHHRLAGGLTTKGPLDVTVKPFATTASIVHGLMIEHAHTLPNEIEGLVLSCILSDTLAFRSPTTTPHDKELAENLATKLGVDINAYANEMFTAKSDVSDFTDIGLLRLDSKKTEVGNKNIRISVIETTNPQSILDRKGGLVTAINTILSEEKDVDDVLLFIIDILKEEATAFTYNQFTKDVISASFGVTAELDTEILPGIVSRKKQIIPALTLPDTQ